MFFSFKVAVNRKPKAFEIMKHKILEEKQKKIATETTSNAKVVHWLPPILPFFPQFSCLLFLHTDNYRNN